MCLRCPTLGEEKEEKSAKEAGKGYQEGCHAVIEAKVLESSFFVFVFF